MKRIFVSQILVCAIFLISLPAASAVTMDWSPVGNPGNAGDTVVEFDGTTGYGSVPYAYNIGTYDVTDSQYVAFLNSNDPTGTNLLGLYDSGMSNATFGGIANTGPNGSVYSVMMGDGNHPVNYVSPYDTLRFANWLNNGQVPGSTETGAYTLLGGTPTPSNANSITRNDNATVFLPSDNEWYKAAYYNPATNSYFQFPTSSNTPPIDDIPTSVPNSANLLLGGPRNLTDVGAYSGTTSPYGAFDMGGNVFNWMSRSANDPVYVPAFVVRGSSFNEEWGTLRSSQWYGSAAFDELGFRVASIPEPGTGVMAVLACGMIWAIRKSF